MTLASEYDKIFTDMDEIIEIKNLRKSFGEVKAVNDLSFKVKKGELFAFLGVNGAGKSTTISIMCGLLKKDDGTVTIDGYDVDNDMEKISSEIVASVSMPPSAQEGEDGTENDVDNDDVNKFIHKLNI